MEAYFLAYLYVFHDHSERARKLAGFDHAQKMIIDELRDENEGRVVRRRPRVTGR
jgi:hypothetical protein